MKPPVFVGEVVPLQAEAWLLQIEKILDVMNCTDKQRVSLRLGPLHNQHIYYFWSQTGNVIDNNAIMVRLFIGILKGVAFDWFRSLPNGSINS